MAALARLRRMFKPQRIGHPAKGVPQYVGDSIRGLRWMFRIGKRQADRNTITTKDRVPLNTHWDRPLMHTVPLRSSPGGTDGLAIEGSTTSDRTPPPPGRCPNQQASTLVPTRTRIDPVANGPRRCIRSRTSTGHNELPSSLQASAQDDQRTCLIPRRDAPTLAQQPGPHDVGISWRE
jgi:hypothetical protein